MKVIALEMNKRDVGNKHNASQIIYWWQEFNNNTVDKILIPLKMIEKFDKIWTGLTLLHQIFNGSVLY